MFLTSELNTSLSPGSKPTLLYSACDAGTGSLRRIPPLSAGSLCRHQRKSARLEEKECAPSFHSTVFYPGSSRSFQFTYFSTLRAIMPPQKYHHQMAGTPSQRVKNQLSRASPPSF